LFKANWGLTKIERRKGMSVKTKIFLGLDCPFSRRKDTFKEKKTDRGHPARDDQCIILITGNNTLRIGKLNPCQRPIELLDLNEGQVQRNVIGQQLTPVTLRQGSF